MLLCRSASPRVIRAKRRPSRSSRACAWARGTGSRCPRTSGSSSRAASSATVVRVTDESPQDFFGVGAMHLDSKPRFLERWLDYAQRHNSMRGSQAPGQRAVGTPAGERRGLEALPAGAPARAARLRPAPLHLPGDPEARRPAAGRTDPGGAARHRQELDRTRARRDPLLHPDLGDPGRSRGALRGHRDLRHRPLAGADRRLHRRPRLHRREPQPLHLQQPAPRGADERARRRRRRPLDPDHRHHQPPRGRRGGGVQPPRKVRPDPPRSSPRTPPPAASSSSTGCATPRSPRRTSSGPSPSSTARPAPRSRRSPPAPSPRRCWRPRTSAPRPTRRCPSRSNAPTSRRRSRTSPGRRTGGKLGSREEVALRRRTTAQKPSPISGLLYLDIVATSSSVSYGQGNGVCWSMINWK